MLEDAVAWFEGGGEVEVGLVGVGINATPPMPLNIAVLFPSIGTLHFLKPAFAKWKLL